MELDPKKTKFNALDYVVWSIRASFQFFISSLLSVGEFSFCDQFDTCERIIQGNNNINRIYFEMDTFHMFN